MIGASCLYAAQIHDSSNPTRAISESQVLQGGLDGGLGGGLGSEKPASALGNGLGGGLGGGLGSENPASPLGNGLGGGLGGGLGSTLEEPSLDDYINFDEILNPGGKNPWDDTILQ